MARRTIKKAQPTRTASTEHRRKEKRPTKKLSKIQKRGGWNPNSVEFDEGQKYLREVYKRAGVKHTGKVLTSRDPAAKRALDMLETTNAPKGFRKWQLPFSLFKPSNTYVTFGEPGATVPTHAHIHGAGFRLIIDGSIILNKMELTAGDWFYVPEKVRYAYDVGPRGVSLVASYEC